MYDLFNKISNHVFVIAEAGVNHNNKLDLAIKMVDKAKSAGADAIKFQTFITDEIQLKTSQKPNYQSKIKKKSYYEIIKSLEPIFSDQIKISKYCKKKKIIFLSTPYDIPSVDFLYKLQVPAFKISSSDLTNHILLRYVAKKRKPIILSTGLSNIDEVTESINLLKKYHMKKKIILLHTNSDYPTKSEDINLKVLSEYIEKFHIPVGFSDHSQNEYASLGAVALGACVLEKHFTLDRSLLGPDQSSSLEPDELKDWIKNIREMEKILGRKKKIITSSEKKNLSMKKILVIKNGNSGEIIKPQMITAMRGTKNGIIPTERNINKIIGKKLTKSISRPMQFSWSLIR